MTVFLPFALGYCLSFLFRTVNAVIAEELTRDLGLGAASLGVLTSAYFISFAAFQLPLGILLDRYGPRRVEAALLLVAAAGALLFGLGDSLTALAAGRALIGLGVSACLMGAFTANVQWWPRDRLPLVNGLTMAFGGLGAVLATTPVAALLPSTGWRGLFLGLAAITLATAALLFLTVPERRDGAHPAATLGTLARGTAEVFASRAFWRMIPACMLVQGTMMAYIGLWIAGWLRDVAGLDRAAMAEVLQWAAAALGVGYLGTGAVVSLLEHRLGVPARVTAFTAMGISLAILGLLAFQAVEWPGLWAIYPLFATAAATLYAILSRDFPAERAGRVNTAVNVMSFISAFVLQAGIGAVIALFPADEARGHRVALFAVLTLQAAAWLWGVWPRRRDRGRRQATTSSGSATAAPDS